MADYFSRPVRLTRAEALALYLRGTELLGAGGVGEVEALRAALAKIAEALGARSAGRAAGRRGRDGRRPDRSRRCAKGSRIGRALEIEYYSANRDELTTRHDRSRARLLGARATGMSSPGTARPRRSAYFASTGSGVPKATGEHLRAKGLDRPGTRPVQPQLRGHRRPAPPGPASPMGSRVLRRGGDEGAGRFPRGDACPRRTWPGPPSSSCALGERPPSSSPRSSAPSRASWPIGPFNTTRNTRHSS